MRVARDAAGGVTFINARIGEALGTLRISGSIISAINEQPRPGDRLVDLTGDRLLPGLINAHDHLQLNNFPAPGVEPRYQHVRQWIAAINRLRQTDAAFEACVAISRNARLMVGGIKNLLGGVTTVAHHDPLYPMLCERDFPVSVVSDYGWSHSLYLETGAAVSQSYRRTPRHRPWIIHAAEGVDAEAAAEFERLEQLGCMKPNTVIVHGVALDPAQRQRLQQAGAALVWCPASNLRLFGRTAELGDLTAGGRVALGTDSRLSGSRDLLEELTLAAHYGFSDAALQSMVTTHSAQILRLDDRGELRVGWRADLLVLPAQARLSNATRAQVRLVAVNGEVRYGDAAYASAFSPESEWAPVRVDGEPKVLHRDIAARYAQLKGVEPGLELAGHMGLAA